MKSRHPLAVLTLLALALSPWAPPVHSQGDPAAPPAKQGAPEADPRLKQFEADLKADKEGLATKLAQEMIRRTGRTYRDTPEEKARQARDKAAVLSDIQGEPSAWSKVALLLMLEGKGELTDKEKGELKTFDGVMNASLGDEKIAANLKNLSAMRDSIESIKDSAGLRKFYDNEQAMRDRYRAPAVQAETPGGMPSTQPILKESEVIRGFEAGDAYLYKDGSFKVKGPKGQDLRVMLRGKSDDPLGRYVYIADVSKDRDIRGMTLPLVDGTEAAFSLQGQNIAVTVAEEEVKGEKRKDLVVHVYEADKDGKIIKGKDGAALETDAISLGGADGLAARALHKAVEGHRNADGSRETYVTYFGEGGSRKKYYTSLQGGATAGLMYFPADEADAAYAAIQKGQSPERLGSMLPRFTADLWQCDSGAAKPITDKGSTVIKYGENDYYQYKFDLVSASWTLQKVAKPAEDTPAKGGKDGDKPAGKTEPAAPGAADGAAAPAAGAEQGGAADSEWPATIGNLSQSGINTVLKQRKADYRVYRSQDGRLFAIGSADRNAALSEAQLKERELPTLGAQVKSYETRGAALAVDVGGRTLLFDLTNPRTMKDTPTTPDGNADALKMDMVIAKPENGLPDLRITNTKLLKAGLQLLGMKEKPEISTIIERTSLLSTKGAIETVQAVKKGEGYTVRVKMKGSDTPIIVWPKLGAKPADGPKASEDAPPPVAGDSGAEASGSNVYLLGPTGLGASAGGPWPMEAELKTLVQGKEVMLFKDNENPVEKVVLYCDKKPCPAQAGEARWFARWRIFQTKPGVAFSRYQFPADVVDSGENTPAVQVMAGMALKHLVVQDINDKSQGLQILPDRKHKGALEATLLPSSDANKHEMFVGHVAYLGKTEPNAKEHEAAYADTKTAEAPKTGVSAAGAPAGPPTPQKETWIDRHR